jgi:hypothetical protein
MRGTHIIEQIRILMLDDIRVVCTAAIPILRSSGSEYDLLKKVRPFGLIRDGSYDFRCD